MATGLTDSQRAADLERALRSMEPPVGPRGLVPALAGALAASVDPQRGLSHLLRYLACLGDAGAFWDACRARPEFPRRLAAVFAASRFLSGVLWRDPQLALWLCEEALVAPPPAPDALVQNSIRRSTARRARSTRPPSCCASRTGICCAWGRAT